MRCGLHPGSGVRFPGPAFCVDVAIGVEEAGLHQRAPPESGFFAGRLEQPGHALFKGIVKFGTDGGDRNAQRGSPSGDLDIGGGAPASIGQLPGFEQYPGAISRGLAVKCQSGPGGGFQPGLFLWKIAPATVAVLRFPECVQTRFEIQIDHAISSAVFRLSFMECNGTRFWLYYAQCRCWRRMKWREPKGSRVK
jgi:hypothetical protein